MDLLQPFKLLGDMFYPNVCIVCGQWLVYGEEGICMHCLDGLPRTGYLLQKGNPVEKIFWGRIPLNIASSYLHFHENGMVQKILHSIKYKGKKDLAETMGMLFAADLTKSNPNFKPDIIIPVPLHPKKERQRGYNQSYFFAKGLATVFQCDVRNDILCRNKHSASQTKKGRYDRWENVGEVFGFQSMPNLQNKFILIVDDVITTGATAEACFKTLNEMDQITLGFLSLAIASS